MNGNEGDARVSEQFEPRLIGFLCRCERTHHCRSADMTGSVMAFFDLLGDGRRGLRGAAVRTAGEFVVAALPRLLEPVDPLVRDPARNAVAVSLIRSSSSLSLYPVWA